MCLLCFVNAICFCFFKPSEMLCTGGGWGVTLSVLFSCFFLGESQHLPGRLQ